MAQTQLRSNNQPVLLPELGFVIVSSTVNAEITTLPDRHQALAAEVQV